MPGSTPSWGIQSGAGESSREWLPARLALAPGRSRDADVVQGAVVIAPVRVDLDPKVEEDPGREELLEVEPCLGPDPLDHLPAAADDDRLLRFGFDVDGAVQPQDPAALLLVELIDN